LVPTFIPFTIHWYAGKRPPFCGMEVYVTGCPWHDGFAEDETAVLTGRVTLTVIDTGAAFAGFPVVHESAEVSLQVTMSPFEGMYVYVELFVPTTWLFTFHWYWGAAPPLTGVAVYVT
jgi:hypothetical protein